MLSPSKQERIHLKGAPLMFQQLLLDAVAPQSVITFRKWNATFRFMTSFMNAAHIQVAYYGIRSIPASKTFDSLSVYKVYGLVILSLITIGWISLSLSLSLWCSKLGSS